MAEAHILDRLRTVSDAYSRGDMGVGEARNTLKDFLRLEGFTPREAGLRNLASTARLNLILRQNASMAHAAGEWQRMHDPDQMAVFPYVRYHSRGDLRTRDSHSKLDGNIYRKDDPFLRTHTPPWEFNCNCWVENCDDAPESPEVVKKLTPEDPPKSGFQFDPSDAFEDYKVANYQFDSKEPAAILKARSDAEQLKKNELKKMYRDVEARQPGIIEQSDDFWSDLKPEERDLITRYTAGDQFDLNKASRGGADITDAASREMDELSAVLKKAPKYTGGQVYRVLNVYSKDAMKDLSEDIEKTIFGLKGFNSASVTMSAAKRYAKDEAKYKVVFHIVRSRNGAFIGQHSWVNTDKEVLFDKKIKFRALHPWEDGYIKKENFDDGFEHIAIVEV